MDGEFSDDSLDDTGGGAPLDGVSSAAEDLARPPTGHGRWGYADPEEEDVSQQVAFELPDMEEDSLDEGEEDEDDEEEMDEEERDAMLQDLKGIWQSHKEGQSDLSQVLDVMAEMASRPGTGAARPGTGRLGSARPGTGLDSGRIGSARPGTGSGRPGTASARPGTSSGRPGTAELPPAEMPLRVESSAPQESRPGTSLGLRPDMNDVPPSREGSYTVDRPRTACDPEARLAAMKPVSVMAVPVHQASAVSAEKYHRKTPRATTPRIPTPLTPRGINALHKKRNGDEPPRTPFTAEGRTGSSISGSARPLTGRHRPEQTAIDGLILAQAMQEEEAEVLDTDLLPDHKGTEQHQDGVDVWIRDDDEEPVHDGGIHMGDEQDEQDEVESVAGLVAEMRQLDDEGVRPQTGQRIATAQADDQAGEGVAARPMTAKAQAAEAESEEQKDDEGACSVVNTRLSEWLNDGEEGSDGAEPEAAEENQVLDDTEVVAFQSAAMRSLLLDDNAAEAGGQGEHREGPKNPEDDIVAEMEDLASRLSALGALGAAEDEEKMERPKSKVSKPPSSASRPSSSASRGGTPRASGSLQVDCNSGMTVVKKRPSSHRNSTSNVGSLATKPSGGSREKLVEGDKVQRNPPPSGIKPPGSGGRSSSTGKPPPSAPRPSRKQNGADDADSSSQKQAASKDKTPKDKSSRDKNKEKAQHTAAEEDSQGEDGHLIYAANSSLLADMLGTGDDVDVEAAGRSTKMRREVVSHRSRGSSPSDGRPGSSRDIGDETRRRAQQVIDKERQKSRETTLRGAGQTQRPRVH